MNFKRTLALILSFCMILTMFSACGKNEQDDLVDMEAITIDGKRAIVWENRTYELFCVVSKKDCGDQIGYVEGDTVDRISAYKDYPPEEWLVSWLPMEGGAMLLKEQNVVDIPDGLEAEY